MRIKPFAALRPPQALVDQVASQPYDVIDSQEARVIAEGNPHSFLHIIKPEIDLPEGADLYSDAVYAKAKENFERFISEGTLVQEEQPRYYLYRQEIEGHAQTGLVAACHVEDYENNLIKKHEKTLKKKEDDRTRHVETLMANAGPVFLTYRAEAAMDAVVTKEQAADPLYDFTAEDGVRHTVWIAQDTAAIEAAFASVPCSYVADGHHRSASAARVAKSCGDKNPDHTGEELYNWFLCVLFPAEQLNVLAYNRSLQDLNGLSADTFLESVKQNFSVTENTAGMPTGACAIEMYLAGTWYGLSWENDPATDPVSALDVSVLQDRILSPLLGVEDPKNNPRIGFVGGIHGPGRLKELVDSGKAAVAFSMYPVAVEQMMAVADEDRIMPPKSTWFEPKLRSGLLVNRLEA